MQKRNETEEIILKNSDEREKFNSIAGDWNKNIPQKNYKIVLDLIDRINLKEGNSVLDVGAGTGILYWALKERELSNYIAIDISDEMVKKFLSIYPDTDVRCMDFEKKIVLSQSFDYIIIFNSIPHFNDLNVVFENAFNNLKVGGKFVIAHSKTRQGLLDHHKKIGYKSDKKEPIPLDETLLELCSRYNFRNIETEDVEYYYFCATRCD